MLHWQWPWAIPIAFAAACAIGALAFWLNARGGADPADAVAWDVDDGLGTERGSRMLRLWRRLNHAAGALIALALMLACVFAARPAQVDEQAERSATRDIVLCLDVSGSALPYDRQVIDTYRSLVTRFRGERIGMSIFNSTSRTVFPLTDDYAMVSRQLDEASTLLKGVESQDDIDGMSDRQYQQVSDWLAGTQNRKNATSLIGDGLVSCAAMLPGFSYGKSSSDMSRDASIVLATDNVVSGTPTYTLDEALTMTSKAHIAVDGLFSGPAQSEGDEATTRMRTLIERHGGVFLTQSNGDSVDALVRSIDARRTKDVEEAGRAAWTDAPGWWTLALAVLAGAWLLVAWRLAR